MTAPTDPVTRARQLLNAYAEDVFLPLTDTVADVVLSSGEHVPVDRVSAHALRVIALPVIADLLAELDARTDPDLAARLLNMSKNGYDPHPHGVLRAAARKLGGEA